MKRGFAAVFTALLVLCFTQSALAGELRDITLLDLPDRDAVVLEVNGEALTSSLTNHKIADQRLDIVFDYSGSVPAVPSVNGDLIESVSITEMDGGFLLSLELSDTVPAAGQSASRETVLGPGQTVIEVFSADSNRSAFSTSWLDGGQTIDMAETVDLVDEPAGFSSVGGSISAVDYDQSGLVLTISGVSAGSYTVEERKFPSRVDVVLEGFSAPAGVIGYAFKDFNSGSVSAVEVVDSKLVSGIEVRANHTEKVALVNEQLVGDNLVLTFGMPAGNVNSGYKAFSQPSDSNFGSNSMTSSGGNSAGASFGAGQQTPNTAPKFGGQLSSAAGTNINPDDARPVGFGGQMQSVPSVETILQMAQDDAYRYGKQAGDRTDTYGDYELPGFEGDEELLSDVRVNLDASGGFSLFGFLNFLSSISGISIIIDPYWFDDPTGLREDREPLEPEIPEGGGGGPGFRPGGVFNPNLGAGGGTVLGSFDNVPFDVALDLVLETHGLEKVVYRDEADPYSKPVILITSKERKEQEIKGTNEIALYQLHYADPIQIYQILFNLNLLPSITVGWYVYQGFGGGGGGIGGGGGGGGFGGGGGGGGLGGGGGGGGGGFNSANVNSMQNVSGAVRSNYFDPMDIGGSVTPTQGGGGIGGGGGGGAGGGGGGIGGGGGTGGGGGNNNGALPLPTAKSGLVVMRGTTETLNTVQSLIAKIDRPPKQVALKVKVYQVSHDPQEVWGLLRATAQDNRLNAVYELGSLSFNVLPKGGVLLDENYSAAFEFLQQERKANLITETEVAVIDGFTATINNTRTRGQLSGTLVITPDGQVINQPVFNPVTVGTTLTFIPQVDDRGRVTMNVNITLSNFDGPQQRASANNQEVTFQPTVNTTLTTTLRMIDGQTALIGGLATSEDSVQFFGIPYLSKLPIIGQFFGRTEKQRNESFIFITLQVNIIDDK